MSGRVEPHDFSDRSPEYRAGYRDALDQVEPVTTALRASIHAQRAALDDADRAPLSLVPTPFDRKLDPREQTAAERAAEAAVIIWPHVAELNLLHEIRPGRGRRVNPIPREDVEAIEEVLAGKRGARTPTLMRDLELPRKELDHYLKLRDELLARGVLDGTKFGTKKPAARHSLPRAATPGYFEGRPARRR